MFVREHINKRRRSRLMRMFLAGAMVREHINKRRRSRLMRMFLAGAMVWSPVYVMYIVDVYDSIKDL
jgi:hypothetical protein